MAVELTRGTSDDDIVTAYAEGANPDLIALKTERDVEVVLSIIEAGRDAGKLGVEVDVPTPAPEPTPEPVSSDTSKAK